MLSRKMRIETKKYLNPSGESISAHVGQGGIEKSQEIKASNAGVRRKKSIAQILVPETFTVSVVGSACFAGVNLLLIGAKIGLRIIF